MHIVFICSGFEVFTFPQCNGGGWNFICALKTYIKKIQKKQNLFTKNVVSITINNQHTTK